MLFQANLLHSLPMVLKIWNGTEQNGTNRTVIFRRWDERWTYFCLHIVLHRWYRNLRSVYVATLQNMATYMKAWYASACIYITTEAIKVRRLCFLPRSGQTHMVNQGKFCCLPSAQPYIRARYGKSCVSSISQCANVALSSYCTLPLMCYTENWVLIRFHSCPSQTL